MKRKPVLIIVGRPNVGKSCLFNRIVGRRAAVVDDTSGVTRDRNYTLAQWGACEFMMADTGGVVPPGEDTMSDRIREQVEMAIEEADAIVFLTDITTGLTKEDLFIAKMLRKRAADRVIVAANKAESKVSHYDLGSFMQLGLGEALPTSALHGFGMRLLLDRVVGLFETTTRNRTTYHREGLRIAVLGRPNAGKSSLVNKLLNTERMIVHDVPGTTRDAIDSHLTYHGKDLILIDTAGLRKRTHVDDKVEYYSNLRAIDSITRADVCVLVIDAARGIGEQDLRILAQIGKARKACVVCLNKWDLVTKDYRTFDDLCKELRAKYYEMKYLPILSVSAKTGQRVHSVIEQALAVHPRMSKRVPVGQFRNLLKEWVTANPHPMVRGKTVRVMGGNQAQSPYPHFLMFAGNHLLVNQVYARYLLNHIHEAFDFEGCPMEVSFKPPAVPTRGKHRYANAMDNDSGDNG